MQSQTCGIRSWRLATTVFSACLVLSIFQLSRAGSPNILLILADDLAWTDLGCYGHPWHETPNIDRLAEEGMRFTNGYAPAPICSASRASILTGKTTARLRFEFVTKDKPGRQTVDADVPLNPPKFTLNLHLFEKTIAEQLAELGYQTAFFGKWHLNAHHERYLGWSPIYGPQQQGFEIAVDDFGAHPFAWQEKTPDSVDTPQEYVEDSMVDGVCKFLSEEASRPFFAMASSYYVHTPVKTSCKWLIDKYEQNIPQDVPQRDKRVAYAAFVESFDHYVGQILDALEESGNKNDTIVVFTSDNGGHPEYAANGPLRGSKWNLYEGGIRVPMIVSWPGQISAGVECDVPVVGYDLFPTFVDFAGDRATHVDGVSLRPLLLSGSVGEQADLLNRSLVWHFPYYHPERDFGKALDVIGVNDFAVSKTRPQSAIRRGNLKLLHFAEDDRVELYDLSKDPSEEQDLSQSDGEVAQELRDQLRDSLMQMNARMAKRSSVVDY